MLDLKALNESFDRINSIKNSGKLFEEFCEDCSESGIDKEDILDWLSEHEQLWDDCEKHFVQDPTWLSADELESFICEHEEACKDYAKAFGFALEENLNEDTDPEKDYDNEMIRKALTRARGYKKPTPEMQKVLDKYGIKRIGSGGMGFDNPNGVYAETSFIANEKDSKVDYVDQIKKMKARAKQNQYYLPTWLHPDDIRYTGNWYDTYQQKQREADARMMRANHYVKVTDLKQKQREKAALKDLLKKYPEMASKENLKEELTGREMDECLDAITKIIYKNYIDNMTKDDVIDLLNDLKEDLFDQIDFIHQESAEI